MPAPSLVISVPRIGRQQHRAPGNLAWPTASRRCFRLLPCPWLPLNVQLPEVSLSISPAFEQPPGDCPGGNAHPLLGEAKLYRTGEGSSLSAFSRSHCPLSTTLWQLGYGDRQRGTVAASCTENLAAVYGVTGCTVMRVLAYFGNKRPVANLQRLRNAVNAISGGQFQQ